MTRIRKSKTSLDCYCGKRNLGCAVRNYAPLGENTNVLRRFREKNLDSSLHAASGNGAVLYRCVRAGRYQPAARRGGQESVRRQREKAVCCSSGKKDGSGAGSGREDWWGGGRRPGRGKRPMARVDLAVDRAIPRRARACRERR